MRFHGVAGVLEGTLLVAVLLVLGYGLVVFVTLQAAGTWWAYRERRAAAAGTSPAHADEVTFYYLVPCRDEELVVHDTVASLLAQDDHSLVVVIDDASVDATATVAEAFGRERVLVDRRTLPDARTGKGHALNHGLRAVRADVTRRGLDAAHVVVVVVDADGRLSTDASRAVTALFGDPRVGGVQLPVRIRNRHAFLTRVQDMGFWGTSAVSQLGRNVTRSVSLGGNAQFTRLSALDTVGGEPWSQSLTEDLDLQISLVARGWVTRQTSLAWVDQEGPESFGNLVRQRTRWAQGHMVCAGRTRELWRSPVVDLRTATELTAYLWKPWLLNLPWSVIAPVLIVLAVFQVRSVADASGALAAAGVVLAAYVLAFVPFAWGAWVYSRRAHDFGFVRSFWLHQGAYVLTAVTFLATWRALGRILTGRDTWAKTARSGR